jgi:hypothetical protein
MATFFGKRDDQIGKAMIERSSETFSIISQVYIKF